ncbi:DUF192 domain-containing protein [Devosia sp. A449]
MMLSALDFAPVLRRAGAVIAIAALALPLPAFADDSRLVLHSATGDYSFNVDVVDTPESRAQGLMFVTELADDAGMLFDFKEVRPVSFWMRNTFIPLDMIFVDADGVIKSIHVNARPHDVTSIPSGAPVQFVLEIPGGRSVEIGLKPGDTMEHDRVGTLAD